MNLIMFNIIIFVFTYSVSFCEAYSVVQNSCVTFYSMQINMIKARLARPLFAENFLEEVQNSSNQSIF